MTRASGSQARPRRRQNAAMPHGSLVSQDLGETPVKAEPNGAATQGDEVADFKEAILEKLTYSVGKDRGSARDHDWFAATALAIRDQIIDRWMDTTHATYQHG